MVDAGILTEDDRVELVDGEVVEMTPIGGRHAACVDRLLRLFTDTLGHDVQIRVQSPVRLNDFTEPQPDLSLLQARADFYASGHPGPADILLLVEVADSSEALDRQVKVPLYARSGILEVWLIDLSSETITTFRDPGTREYRSAVKHHRGDQVTTSALPGLQFMVADVLGDG
jgi:Uma2 family endonuclease